MENKESAALSFALGLIIVSVFWYFYKPPLMVEEKDKSPKTYKLEQI